MKSLREVDGSISQTIDSMQPEEDPETPRATNSLAYPEGGREGWLVVVGSFCASMSVFGVINTAAVFESYFSQNQLRNHTKSEIGWIFSTYLFIVYFAGIPIGFVFDRHGPRVLVAVGSICMVASLMILSVCKEYYQFILTFSVLMGVGGSLLNTPAVAVIGHYFCEKRGMATGLATSAGSIGGLVFPLLLRATLPKYGFPWSMRILGFILFFLAIPTNLFIRSRLLLGNDIAPTLPNLMAFRDPKFLLCCGGICFMEYGVLIPLTFVVSFANSHGQNDNTSYLLPALLNASSVLGRAIPGLIADRIGRFNTLVFTVGLCTITVLGLWLPSGESSALLIVFVIFLGFASGGNVSLIPVCIGQLCDPQQYGQFLSTAMIGASFGTLTGIPIGGALFGIGSERTGWLALVLFSGLSYVVSFACYLAARILAVGWGIKTVF